LPMTERSRRGPASHGASPDAALEAAVASALSGHAPPDPDLVRALAGWPRPRGGGPASGDPVAGAVSRALVAAVAAAWQRGWQPADVHRVVERQAGRAAARLAAQAMHHEVARHPDGAVPLRWRLQLDALGGAGVPRAGGDSSWALPTASAADPVAARLPAVEV